jgi:hypothetical protein
MMRRVMSVDIKRPHAPRTPRKIRMNPPEPSPEAARNTSPTRQHQRLCRFDWITRSYQINRFRRSKSRLGFRKRSLAAHGNSHQRHQPTETTRRPLQFDCQKVELRRHQYQWREQYTPNARRPISGRGERCQQQNFAQKTPTKAQCQP